MQLIDQHAKAIMEGCKERARDAGLRFDDESLEYVVTNRDLTIAREAGLLVRAADVPADDERVRALHR